MNFKQIRGYATIILLIAGFLTTILIYFSSPKISEAEKINTQKEIPIHTGKYILIHLDTMTLDLKDGVTTLQTIPLVSKGKPASYYETIGGYYLHDYKEPLHFSSIGHVYMPYSVHIFGNFFIHGIPYYPDGTKVSSSYSGGCIRLSDDDAKTVYDFIERGTPIIITQHGEYDFSPTPHTPITLESITMTRLMVATISLEFLTQDNEINTTSGTTTRRTLLKDLLDGDDTVSTLYAQAMGKNTFIQSMNDKVKSLGLTNTVFIDVTQEAQTTPEDYERFMNYIGMYKAYLLTISSSTPTISQ